MGEKDEELTPTAISTASFCMSGSISALLMMTFLGGVGVAAAAAAADGFRSSESGLPIRAPGMLFFASSLIISSLPSDLVYHNSFLAKQTASLSQLRLDLPFTRVINAKEKGPLIRVFIMYGKYMIGVINLL